MNQTELILMQRCFTDFHNNYPALRGLLCTYWNNAHNAAYGNKMRSMGVVAGVSDMFYIRPLGCITWLEFKVGDGKQSDKQTSWEQTVKALNHDYRICRTYEQFWDILGLAIPTGNNNATRGFI